MSIFSKRKNKDVLDRQGERGFAATETAMFLLVLAPLLFVMVEGTNAIRSQMILQETSREAARMIMRQGDADGVDALIDHLTVDLAGDNPATRSVTQNPDNSITVRVGYVYQTLFFGQYMQSAFPDEVFALEAATTMPMP